MTTTKEKIEVMQAYERGEQIEWKTKDAYDWNSYSNTGMTPIWNWGSTDYRVKPKSTYRPYKNAEEFLQAQREHGMYIKSKYISDRYELPTTVDDEMVAFLIPNDDGIVYSLCYHYDNLLADKVWQDGTPCGVKEE